MGECSELGPPTGGNVGISFSSYSCVCRLRSGSLFLENKFCSTFFFHDIRHRPSHLVLSLQYLPRLPNLFHNLTSLQPHFFLKILDSHFNNPCYLLLVVPLPVSLLSDQFTPCRHSPVCFRSSRKQENSRLSTGRQSSWVFFLLILGFFSQPLRWDFHRK